MKKLYLKCLLLGIFSLAGIKALAYDCQVDGIYYDLNTANKTATVTSGDSKYSDAVTIPSSITYNGTNYSVTSIGWSAFQGCRGLTSVTIPESVTSIGGRAFEGCRGLTSVNIGNNVTSIGWGAFQGCRGLTSLSIPNSVTSIGWGAFQGCRGLTSVAIGNSVTSIGEIAFGECYNLNNVIVKDIAAWYNISFGDFEANPLYYANHLFCDVNREITELTIPNSVTSIGKYAFVNCSSLTSVTIPSSVTSIGDYAFCCSGLTSVNIGNSVTSIGDGAFEGCSGLTSVTIPESVTSIGEYAFNDGSDPAQISPNNVTSIRSNAFSECCGLTSITSYIFNPFYIRENVFSIAVYNNATLYVPSQSLELYQTTEGWKEFKNIKPLAFHVLQSELIRMPKQIHLKIMFSFEPNEYTALDEYVSLVSKDESLKLLSFAKSGQSYDLFFEIPKKEGVYTLKVSNAIMDVAKQELDQNGNGITGEDDDNYTEDFMFGNNELFVVAQSPTTGVKGEKGYTDVVLNDEIGSIPFPQCSLLSPSRKYATITKIEYLENLVPARHRIYYDALDEDGIYTFTLNKGLKSAKDKEMRYDYQSTIELPCADLHPIVFGLEKNYVVGQKLPITYQVENIGTMPANGSSINVLYLSSSEELNHEAIEIYRDTVDVNIQSQESYTHTVDITIPHCIDGRYFLILKTNVARTINELSFENNTLVSEALSLSVDWLSEDNNKFTLGRGESRLFKVPVTSDKNIEVIDKDGCANMYVGYSGFPDTNNDPKKGSVIILSPDESMTYYLLVSNDDKNQVKSQPCELSILQFDIDIASVGRENVVKHKTAWIPIEVIGCTDMPVFYLMDGQGKKTENKKVYAKSESSFYAQFDTEVLQAGKYNLYVECDGKAGMLPNAITIKQEEALPHIDAKLILPKTSRIGSTITAYIDYKNTGNVDVSAPLFILTGQKGSKYSLDDHEFITDEVHVIGINEKGVMSALLPGESNRISVEITIPNEQIYSADYKLKIITEGCDGIDEPFYLQWLDVDPEEKPTCYTDEEWSAYCTRLRNNVGDTWQTFIEALGTVANMYFSADYIEHDAQFLYSILKEIDLQVAINNSKHIKKKTPDTLRDVEAGTLFVWKNGQWNQVIQKSGPFSGWETTENIKLVNLSASKNFIISHGWNDDRNGNTKWLAQALERTEDNCNIFGIDWSKKATYPSFWFALTANKPALEIPGVANQVVDGLCTIFGTTKGSLRINNLHLIGHSHGAHLCGMIAHKLNFKPKRLTALDASQQLSHVGWSYYGSFVPNIRNFMGLGWSSSDVQFLDYYKSSVMAGTNRFKGNNNFILIESDNGFVFDKFSDEATETIRHGYSILWFALSILNKDLKIGYNLSPNYLKDNWGSGYNESQYHGVIHGSNNIIENFSIRDERGISTDKWNYTEPWYEKKFYQGVGNDNIFQNALAKTIEYAPISIDPYHDGNEHLEAGTEENVKVRFKNKADNFTIPLNIRESEVRGNVTNAIFITKSNNSKEYSTIKNNDGIYEVKTKAPLYLLGYDSSYGDISKDETKETESNISFTISKEQWDRLAGSEKDEEYIYCDLWFISGSDKSSLLKGWADSSASMYYSPSEWKHTPVNVIQLWKGELYPDNNVIIENVKVKRPTLACDAGNDITYTLGKGQKTMNVNVNGIVERDNGMNLSYYWEKGRFVFSNSKNGFIPLGVGSHTLTFRIKAQNGNNAKAAFAPTSSANEASDNVVITVRPYTPGDEDDESTETASSWDPNEKVGIRGAGGKSCVRQGETMEYAIYFENDAEKAQLAAQTVTVIDTLDTAFDLSTFEFKGSEVANTYIDIPSGKAETTVYTDLRPANDLILKADMKLNIDTRELKVVYSSLDTLTYEPTQDVFAGFLPPNDSTHIGEGHFSYRVKLKNDVPDGYQVKNQAHIFFDYNDEIATNTTCHVVDSHAPISSIESLPSTTMEDSLLVSWSGIDVGAGIRFYDIYRSKNGSNYELWLSHELDNSAYQYGTVGDVFSYYSIATDSLGIVEKMKSNPEATVRFVSNSDRIILMENDQVIIDYENDAFVITGAEGASCNVYDLSGQLMISKRCINYRQRIGFVRKGTYIVNVETPDGVTYSKKMVVK